MKRTWCWILALTLLLAAAPAALADSDLIHLPDLMTYSNGQLRLTETDTSRDYLTEYYLEGGSKAVTRVVEEYVALLDECDAITPVSRFPLDSGARVVAYACDAQNVSTFNLNNSGGGWSVNHISLCIEQKNSTSLRFYVATGLSFQNDGDGPRASVEESGSSGRGGASSSGSSSYDPPSYGTKKERCHYCGGDGIDRSCFQCGGDGIMDGSGQRCYACGGSGEHKCNFCGGTGWR